MPAGVALPHDNNLVAGAWGAWTQILLAAAAPAVEYWYCGAAIMADAAAVESHAVNIGSGLVATPPTQIANHVFPATNAVAANVLTAQQTVPYPIYMPAATPISGQSATVVKAAAANITVAVLLGTGL
jgi:hypothetical protein